MITRRKIGTSMAKIISVDFDGVLHCYNGVYTVPTAITNGPVSGAKEFMQRLKEAGFQIYVFSSRNSFTGGKDAVSNWLRKYEIPYDRIVREKPPAFVTLDDRGICFNGEFSDELFNSIVNFKPYWLESKDSTDSTYSTDNKTNISNKKKGKKKSGTEN